ncbi:uncharacterized protein LOC134811484 [Bolinopsis microptera]|uniref:uncharacterized protein LOC134811484 n=1 Tax=Bolinopsis microptera TaxID=2820187 RepID=UPI00307A0B37
MVRLVDLIMAVLCTLLAMCTGESITNPESTDIMATKIGEVLAKLMKKGFDKGAIEMIYSTQSYETYTGLQILEKIEKNVTKQFKNSEKNLRNIRKSALESFYNYTGDTNDFDFLERFQDVTHKGQNMSYQKLTNFKRPVSVTNSSLVIPIDVYYNWTKVRETILWTARMDPNFIANWAPNQTGSATTLQYLGTPHGVMRTYPSYYTPRVGKWITYDCRFRGWYGVGAAESKKVVFLMDMSGTLAVRTGKLMREMAVSIIKTIVSDEDYISVLTFNQVVEPIGCGTQMVRARKRVKDILIGQIRKIKPQGSANLTMAIRMGIEVLNNSKNLDTCHSTLVLFTDYTQRDIVSIFKTYNIDPRVKIVILQVGKDVLFASDLKLAAATLGGFHAQIEDLSDINPTILQLTSELFTSVVDEDELHVKTTAMYKDASTEEYIATLVVPVVTDKAANWTTPSSLPQGKGAFLGVAAVDIEAKSLGLYPLSTARGCYAVTVDLKGSVLYHPVLYGTKESIEIDQKLHLYSYLNNGATMKKVEQGMVFQNFTEQAKLLYLEVSDTSVSKRTRSFANNYFFNVLNAIDEKNSLLHICNRESLAFPKRTNVQKTRVKVFTENQGPQKDVSRDTAYCTYSKFFGKVAGDDIVDNETVEEFINRKFQFPECHDFAYEIFDDIYMVSEYLSAYLKEDPTNLFVTTAAGSRFKIIEGNKTKRTNSPYTRERYTRLVSLVTNSGNNNMLSVTDVSATSTECIFELSQIIYHQQSNSYPLMLSFRVPALKLEEQMYEPFRGMGGSRFLVDENAFIVSSDAEEHQGQHLAKLFPRLMEELLAKGIYNSFNHTECYYSCEDVYPENTMPPKSAADSVSLYLRYPSVRILTNVLFSTASVVMNLLSNIWFFILNPSILVSGISESDDQLKEDWKSIKIDLTCCQIHPFMSRNFSVEVGTGNNLQQSPTCYQSFNYSAVPNTNLLLVWASCTDCSCQGPEYNLETIRNQVLNPCTESDENYNPGTNCATQYTGLDYGVEQREGVSAGTGVWRGSLLVIAVALLYL